MTGVLRKGGIWTQALTQGEHRVEVKAELWKTRTTTDGHQRLGEQHGTSLPSEGPKTVDTLI